MWAGLALDFDSGKMDSVRKRGQLSKKGSQKPSGDPQLQKSDVDKKTRDHGFGSADAKVLFVVAGLLLVAWVSLRLYRTLPESNLATEGNQYSTANARKHLEDIVNLGIRHVGSKTNEVLAKNLILEKVAEIQAKSRPDVQIEVSVQQTSGNYFLAFLGGLTHIYHNVTNVVVKLSGRGSSEHAVMVNAHYDSAIGAPAASDDAVSCATMLEVLRCLSSPSSHPFKHAVIFLFNGAEETILQASHGFITQHPWAKQIRAFINLESAGAGGKELLFQTGPSHPWLAKAYAKVAPYPHGSVFAQELFQSGIIPSDTDFRIFRDYGHIPGIDMAYFVNGYVYHTEYDIASVIPDGSIQRAGENVLALVTELASTSLLTEPGDDKHGKVTYFDVGGLMMVVYPERIGTILNCGTILLSLFVLWLGCRNRREGGGVGLLLKSCVVVLVSQIVGILLPIATAVLLQLTGQSMSWFSIPLLAIPLFFLPSLLGIAAVHSWWKNKHPAVPNQQLVTVSLHAVLLLWTMALILTTYLRLSSSFIPLLWTLPLLLCCLLPALLLPSLLHILLLVALAVPFSLGTHLCASLLDMFVPLTGRSGTVAPPDVAFAVLCGALTHIAAYPVCYLAYASSKLLSRLACVLATVCWLCAVAVVVSGLVFPFTGGASPKPKRLFLIHTQRTFHSIDGTIQLDDSHIFLFPTDYRGLDPLPSAVPALRDAVEYPCTGLYCDAPSFIPVFHALSKFWYIPAPPPPTNVIPSQITLVSNQQTSSNARNFTFHAKFPHRAAMIIAPATGHSLLSWSLENFIPPATPDRGRPGEPTYFIFYARGTGEGEFTFWIEVQSEGIGSESPSLQLSVSAHYLDPPLSQSKELSQLLTAMPDWVTTIAWTCSYTQWAF